MNIKINGKEHSVPSNSNLFNVLEELNISTERGIAVALDNQIIPKSRFTETKIIENNNITIIRATQGG